MELEAAATERSRLWTMLRAGGERKTQSFTAPPADPQPPQPVRRISIGRTATCTAAWFTP